MISTPTTLDKPFAEYVSLLRRLHRLFTDGNGDSAEADALRNEMDAPWHELTEEERGTVSGLAADLNAIRRGAVSSGKSREELLQENEPALARAYQAGEWFEVLKHLRRLAATKKPADVSYLRGRAWSKLLDDETVLLFFQHASVLEPENGVIAYAAMQCLARVDFSEALQRANEVLADPDNHGAEIVVVAAIIRFRALFDDAKRRRQCCCGGPPSVASSCTPANANRALGAPASGAVCHGYRGSELLLSAIRKLGSRSRST